MARFIVRRLLQMRSCCGPCRCSRSSSSRSSRTATRRSGWPASSRREAQIEAIREEWGFNDNIFVQYVTTMKKVFTGDLISYTTQLPVDDEIMKGLPRTLALAFGAAILWMFVAVCFGLYSAMRAGKFADRFLTIIALIGISLARVLDRRADELLPGLQARLVPERRVR